MQELNKKQVEAYLKKAFSLDPDEGAVKMLNPITLHVGKVFIRIESSAGNIDQLQAFIEGLEQ
jgi:hypothetical protein